MKNSTQELIEIAFTPINPIEDAIIGYSAWMMSMTLIGLQIYAKSTGLKANKVVEQENNTTIL